jgi:hypothetical protein
VFLIDPTDLGLTDVLTQAPPFYAAPDFVKPAVPPEK